MESYTYNPSTGNLAAKAGVSYTYDPNHPHAVASLSNSNSYQQDANGNQTTRTIASGPLAGTYSLYYDAENRLAEVKKNNSTVATYAYDGDGKQVQSTVNGVTTSYIGAHYQVEGGLTVKYYLAGATRIAMRTPNNNVSYLLSDHLGSTSLTVDSAGYVTSEMRYTPWGDTRFTSGNSPTNYRFTGQRQEASFGLYFYNARWYDGSLGRFTSADTVVPGGAQGMDRYAYTNNNPVNGTDPTGHQTDEGDGGNYTRQDQLRDATLIKKSYDDLCGRGYDEYCSGPDLYAKHHPKPVTGIFWQCSGQAGYILEGGVTYQQSYVIDWKTGTVYSVITVGAFGYGGSPTGIEGDISFGTQSYYGIPHDIEDITKFLDGPAQEYSVSGNLDAGLLAGAEQNVSVNLNKTGGAMYTPYTGYSYTTEKSIEFGGNAVPNGIDFNVQTGPSMSFVDHVWHLW